MSEENPTAQIATNFVNGNKLYHQRAKLVFPILVRQAKSRQTITYGELALEIGVSNPRVMNWPLGSIGTAIRELNKSRFSNIPMIQAIVINKHKHQPGEGIDDYLNSDQTKKLKTMSRARLYEEILDEVFSFNQWDQVLIALDLEPVTYEDDPIELEFAHRMRMFNQLCTEGGPTGVTPKVLNDLSFYQGQAGIYRDVKRTSKINELGITVSLTHMGDHYPDDLTDSGLVYHYPETDRIGSTDENEIEATKVTASNGLPIFIITTSESAPNLRDVRLGFITRWNDNNKIFNIEFTEKRPKTLEVTPKHQDDVTPFSLNEQSHSPRQQIIKTPYRSPSFKKDVINRYGAKCSICDFEILELLDGAHIKGKQFNGSDDPRNGLVLCANHHRAFDRKLFFITPDTYEIVPGTVELSLEDLRITHTNLNHLTNLPHEAALQWLWDKLRK